MTFATGSAQDDPATPRIAEGTEIDQYKVLRLAGRGGMAEVYLARDLRLGRKVVLKVMSGQRRETPAAVEQFRTEAQLLAHFAHPNIVTIFGFGEVGDDPYFAMEYVEGETLRTRMERGTLTLRDIERTALAIASALAEAHANDIVHGDLKPENVIVSADGRLRVLDFGLAKLFSSLDKKRHAELRDADALANADRVAAAFRDAKRTEVVDAPPSLGLDAKSMASTVQGTPVYMAPEVWSGLPRTPATDIWAFGVMLHELLTGRLPFMGDDILKLVAEVTSDEPLRRGVAQLEVPEPLWALHDRCLNKASEKRPSATELVRALEVLIYGATSMRVDRDAPFRGLDAFTEDQASFFFGRDEDIAGFVERLRNDVVIPIVGASGVGKSSFVQAGVIPRMRERGPVTVIRMRPGADPFRALAVRLLSDRDGTEATSATITTHEVDKLARELHENPKILTLRLQNRAAATQSTVLLLVDQVEEVCTLVPEREVRQRFLSCVCGAADDAADPVRVVLTCRDDFLTRLAESPEARAALGKLMLLRAPGDDALREILKKSVSAVGYSYDDPRLVDTMIASVTNETAALPLLQFAGTMLWERRDRNEHSLLRSAYDEIGGVQGALGTHANALMRELTDAEAKLVRGAVLRLVTPESTRRVARKTDLIQALGPGSESVLKRLTDSRLLTVRQVLDESFLELSHESLVHTWDRLRHWLDEGREELLFLAELDQAAELWQRRGRPAGEVWVSQALSDALRNIDRYSAKLSTRATEFINASKAAEQRRVRLRQALITASALLLIAIAAVSLVTAVRFAEKTKIARQQTAQAEAEGARSAFLRGDYVTAKAQLRSSLEVADSPLVRVLWAKLLREPVIWRTSLPSGINDLAARPGLLAAAPIDGNVYLLDTATSQVRTLREHREHLLSVAFSPDGKTILAGDTLGNIAVWRDGEGYKKITPHHGLVWKLAYSRDGARFASASWDGSVKVFDATSFTVQRTFENLGGAVHRAVFHPNGQQLVVGMPSGTLRVFDLQGDGSIDWPGLHSGPVTALQFSPDGHLLVSGGEDRRLVISEGARALAVVESAHAAAINSVAFDQSNVFSGSWDGSVKRWSLPALAPLPLPAYHPDGSVTSLAVLSDGSIASAGFDQQVVLADPSRAGSSARTLGHLGPLQRVAFAGQRVFSGSSEGRVVGWNVATGAPEIMFTDARGQVSCLAVSESGKWLAAAGDDNTVRIYDLARNTLKSELKGHTNAVRRCVWSGETLLTCGLDRTMKAWDVSGDRLGKSIDLAMAADSIAVRGSRVLIGGAEDSHLLFASIDAAPHRRDGNAMGVAFLPSGDYLLLRKNGDLLRNGMGDKLVSLQGQGTDLAVSRDGQHVAMSSTTGAVLDGKPLLGHIGEVTQLGFSNDGALLATAGEDGTLRLWDSRTGEPHWRTHAVLRSTGGVLSHQGWTGPSGPIGARIETSGAFVEEADGTYCARWQDKIELWGAAPAQLSLAAVQAHPWQRGCVVLGGNGTLHWLKGETKQIAQGVRMVALAEGLLGYVRGSELFTLDQALRVLSVQPVDPTISALSVGELLAVGYPNGGVEILADGAWRPLKLQTAGAGSVSAIIPGPMATLAVGFGSGLVGLYSAHDGSALVSDKLHGKIISLSIERGQLLAVTDLGGATSIDLSYFLDRRCDLLERVAAQVPYVWKNAEVTPATNAECQP